jgi:hypothetical protein
MVYLLLNRVGPARETSAGGPVTLFPFCFKTTTMVVMPAVVPPAHVPSTV